MWTGLILKRWNLYVRVRECSWVNATTVTCVFVKLYGYVGVSLRAWIINTSPFNPLVSKQPVTVLIWPFVLHCSVETVENKDWKNKMRRLPLRWACVLFNASAAGSQMPFLFNEDENDVNVKHSVERNLTVQTDVLVSQEPLVTDTDKSNWFSFFFWCCLFSLLPD